MAMERLEAPPAWKRILITGGNRPRARRFRSWPNSCRHKKYPARRCRGWGRFHDTSAAAPACRRRSRADRVSAVYLRTAQAYMLISMPTGTSTIFGVFQVIGGPPTGVGAMLTPRLNVGPARAQRKGGT